MDPQELFDVVDESDQRIDSLPRVDVHRQKLRHRAVHVFVFRPNGDLLIHRRSPDKEEFPSVWTSSCSGHVSAGESYATAAERELLEELGLRGELQMMGKVTASPETSWEFTVLYQTVTNDPITPDPEEMTATDWMEPEKIAAWIDRTPDDFSPAFELLFRAFRAQLFRPAD